MVKPEHAQSPDARRHVVQPGEAYIERFWADECHLPALRAIGQSRRVVALEHHSAHYERNLEIHLVMDGTVDWWVEGEIYTAPPDSIVITKPNELHGGVKGMIQPSSLTWLQVDLAHLDDSDLAEALMGLDRRVCIGASALVGHARQILRECRNPEQDSSRIIDGHLRLLLAQLLRKFDEVPDARRLPEALDSMLNYIDMNLDEKITMYDLCNHVNLSRSRVFQLFETHIGQSPMSYVMALRIKRAQTLLKSNDTPITTIAMRLGFSSSQHFATVFRRLTGESPRSFRSSSSI